MPQKTWNSQQQFYFGKPVVAADGGSWMQVWYVSPGLVTPAWPNLHII